MIKKCEICGNEFETIYSYQKYCCNECSQIARKEKNKLWAKEHQKELNEKKKIWAKNHSEKIKKTGREYYLKHKKERKQYRMDHKEEIKAYHQIYYQNHKEDLNLADKRRYWAKKIEACSELHDNCFSCPTEDGECLFE